MSLHNLFYLVPLVLRGDQPPPPDTDRFESPEEIHPLTDLSTHWHRRGQMLLKIYMVTGAVWT